MTNIIRVVVCGAAGRMGREVVKAVTNEETLTLVGAVDAKAEGTDAGVLAGIQNLGVAVKSDLKETLNSTKPQVMVDFTAPTSVANNARVAIKAGVCPVIGTTGISAEDLQELADLSAQKEVGAFFAPNFAIGAVLMMRFAETAARYLPDVEIIEMHHDQKLDAPSGTALKTAEKIDAVLKETGVNKNKTDPILALDSVRGGNYHDKVHVHSVRLPGLVAHQEVLFGGLGQTLSIRHDSISRESFMPGVVLAVKRVVALNQLVIGLDRLIFED